jgi:hypothetical protein
LNASKDDPFLKKIATTALNIIIRDACILNLTMDYVVLTTENDDLLIMEYNVITDEFV